MKIKVCRNCEDSNVKVQPLGFNYTKDNAPSYMLCAGIKKTDLVLIWNVAMSDNAPKGK